MQLATSLYLLLKLATRSAQAPKAQPLAPPVPPPLGESAQTKLVSPTVGSPRAEPKPAPGHAIGASIFLCYRRGDSDDVTGRIYDRLTEAFNQERVFKDVDSIPFGVDFRKHLDDMVSKCDVLLAIIGPEWLASSNAAGTPRIEDERDFVRIEIESALKRDIPLIPVVVRGTEIPAENQLPESIRDLAYRNGIPVRADPDFHRDMDRLIEALRKHLPM